VAAGGRCELRAAALEQRDQQRVHRFGSGHAERVHALPKRRRRGHTGDAERLLKERIAAFAFDCFEVTLPFGQQTDVTGQDLAARQTLPHRKPRIDPACNLGEAIERHADEGHAGHGGQVTSRLTDDKRSGLHGCGGE